MEKFNYPDNLRVHLYRRFRWFENRILEQAKKSKYSYLTISQVRIFAFLQGREMNISDLAKLLNISRQAVQKTIALLLEKNLVELNKSPDNLSARLIKITDEGLKIQTWSKKAVARAEKKLAYKIGPEKLKILKEILNENWE
jgi:DNA-binding MarR family transcriptional regulator